MIQLNLFNLGGGRSVFGFNFVHKFVERMSSNSSAISGVSGISGFSDDSLDDDDEENNDSNGNNDLLLVFPQEELVTNSHICLRFY